MIRCPECGNVTAEIKFTGPVIWVEGKLGVDENGRITMLGPARAVKTIRAGDEAAMQDRLFVCSKCKYAGPSHTFDIVRPCIITGRTAEMSIDTPFGQVHIAADQQEAAARIFSQQNGSWQVALPEDIFNV